MSGRVLQRRQVSYYPEGFYLSPSWLRHYDLLIDSGSRRPSESLASKKREVVSYNRRRVEVVRPSHERDAAKPETIDEVREP